MKIIVSKKSMDKNFKSKVNAVIHMAKDCAERGLTSFTFKVEDNLGFSRYDLITEVEKLTEKTVYTGSKCITPNSIKFQIAQENKVYG